MVPSTGAKLECECGKYLSIEETLKKHNEQNRGIFFVVNYGGHDDAAITRINAQFFEMDNGTFEEQQAKVDAFPLPPSMIIRTRKSLHVYYFVDSTAKVARFRIIQQQMVKHFHGDPMCVNESCVMRLPGFNHCKKEPVMVECISFHPERKYTQDQLADALPTIDEQSVEKKCGADKGLDIVMRSCDFLKHCRDDAATLPEHDWYTMITNLASFDGGTALIHEMSAPYPDYNENSTQKKINHFLESGTKPITCKTICEKGFKCPKFAAGECQVKSPAALCYRLMSTDGLMEVLEDIPVTGETLKDLQAAKDFVTDYLFNQDVVIADVMINAEIRDHFKLRATFLKSLNLAYKEASRRYQSGKEVKRLVQEKLLIRESKMRHIVDAEKQWRLLMQKDIRELNDNPFIINVKNGLYNVLEDTLTEHIPDYCSTVQLNVTYDKAADCPRFKQFLAESMGGDMSQVALLQEMLGYFLIPVNSAQKCFVIVGVASAGKSVLLSVLNDVFLGKQNVSNVSWQALNEQFKTAEIFGKLSRRLSHE